jgi:hypothetical protein
LLGISSSHFAKVVRRPPRVRVVLVRGAETAFVRGFCCWR